MGARRVIDGSNMEALVKWLSSFVMKVWKSCLIAMMRYYFVPFYVDMLYITCNKMRLVQYYDIIMIEKIHI